MARTPSRKSPKRSPARKSPKAAPRRTKKAAQPLSHSPTKGLYGWITHTELASADPQATQAWCSKVLGWTIGPSMPTPEGPYTLFHYSDKGGGGIRSVGPDEQPHSTPTVHVADCQKAFDKALSEGAQPVSKPERVMKGVTIALVRAPGGVLIGLSGP
jgi:predicted enzyme related to lactoylglutathione lyase